MKKPPLILTNILLFMITGLIAFVVVPFWAWHFGFDRNEILATLGLFFFTGISITAGYHRLWSHKAYEANTLVRIFLAIGGAMALQNSILHWSSDHRVHHRHVDDNDKDPYSAKKGFWYSHIGWMLREYQPEADHSYANCRDLQKDSIVMWQHNYYLPIMLTANLGITALLGWLNGDIIGMMLLAGVFRLVLVHQATFFINSLAHIWGKQPYSDKNTAKDNGILALLTFGEGYHNFHHIFESDYRNGIRWWQFDPTKWLIALLSSIGWAKNLRRCSDERIEKAKIAMQLQRTQARLSKLPHTEEIMAKVQQEYDLLLQRMVEFYATKKQLMDANKKKLLRSYEKRDLDCKYRQLKQTLAIQQAKWLKLCEQGLRFA